MQHDANAKLSLIYCDSKMSSWPLLLNHCAVVAILHSRSSKHCQIMHLLRCLFFMEAYFHFSLSRSSTVRCWICAGTLLVEGSLEKKDKRLLRDKSSAILLSLLVTKMLTSTAMYAKALELLAFLSLALQSGKADIVMCIKNTLKSVAAFTSLLQKDPIECPWFS